MTESTEAVEPSVEQAKAFAQSQVKNPRWSHIRGVVKMVASIVEHYGAVDKTSLTLAGYLHDTAKNLPLEEQKRLANQYRNSMDGIEESIPALWHAPASAQLVVNEWDLNPEHEIVVSVAFHPTGRTPMSSLLKALIVADFSEENRLFPEAESIRHSIGTRSLTELARTVIAHKLTHCIQQEQRIHPWSVEAYNELCE